MRCFVVTKHLDQAVLFIELSLAFLSGLQQLLKFKSTQSYLYMNHQMIIFLKSFHFLVLSSPETGTS